MSSRGGRWFGWGCACSAVTLSGIVAWDTRNAPSALLRPIVAPSIAQFLPPCFAPTAASTTTDQGSPFLFPLDALTFAILRNALTPPPARVAQHGEAGAEEEEDAWRAVALFAPSGTGKTTILRHFEQLMNHPASEAQNQTREPTVADTKPSSKAVRNTLFLDDFTFPQGSNDAALIVRAIEQDIGKRLFWSSYFAPHFVTEVLVMRALRGLHSDAREGSAATAAPIVTLTVDLRRGQHSASPLLTNDEGGSSTSRLMAQTSADPLRIDDPQAVPLKHRRSPNPRVASAADRFSRGAVAFSRKHANTVVVFASNETFDTAHPPTRATVVGLPSEFMYDHAVAFFRAAITHEGNTKPEEAGLLTSAIDRLKILNAGNVSRLAKLVQQQDAPTAEQEAFLKTVEDEYQLWMTEEQRWIRIFGRYAEPTNTPTVQGFSPNGYSVHPRTCSGDLAPVGVLRWSDESTPYGSKATEGDLKLRLQWKFREK